MEPSPNQDLSDALREISEFYTLSHDVHRSNAYLNAALSIEAVRQEITSGVEARQLIPYGIGKSIMADIDEFINTGKITRLDELRNKYSEYTNTVKLFTQIYGISIAKATRLYNQGYRSLDQLYGSNALTPSEKLATKYALQTSQKIPRAEMDLANSVLQDKLSPIQYVIAGSYRRLLASSSDIDVLVNSGGNITMNDIINRLDGLILTLAQGESSFAGIFIYDDLNAHRIDIILIQPEDWYTALLHFTGSKHFNRRVRQVAKERGLQLSQHGLIELNTGRKYDINSEEDVFNILGLPYLKPEQRI